MVRCLPALLLAVAAGASSAQTPDTDPLHSAECRAARDELEQALGERAANRQAKPERLARARQKVALECLGREDANRKRSGAPQPAQVVPPAAVSIRPAQPPQPPVAPPQPPLAVPRAATITTCDPAGCWDSEGHRLNNMGPLLMGPRGLCTIQGGQLNCP